MPSIEAILGLECDENSTDDPLYAPLVPGSSTSGSPSAPMSGSPSAPTSSSFSAGSLLTLTSSASHS